MSNDIRMNSRKQSHCFLFFAFIVFFLVIAIPNLVQAEEIQTGWRSSDFVKDKSGNLVETIQRYQNTGNKKTTEELEFCCRISDIGSEKKILFSSSDSSVVKIASDSAKYVIPQIVRDEDGEIDDSVFRPARYDEDEEMLYIPVKAVYGSGVGSAELSAQVGNQIYKASVVMIPSATQISSIKSYNYQSVKIEFTKVDNVSGYYIKRKQQGAQKYTIAKTVEGEQNCSAVVKTKKGVKYEYVVSPYVVANGKKYADQEDPFILDETVYCFKYDKAKIMSAYVKGKEATVSWQKDKDSSAVGISYATNPDGKYHLLHTQNDNSSQSYTWKVKPGTTYYLKAEYHYPEETIETSVYQMTVPSRSGRKAVQIQLQQVGGNGQYGTLNWSHPDNTYYYQKNGKLHIVCRNGSLLYDYTLKDNYQIQSKKTIRLEKFDTWGGFYYGTDGKYYVVTGYNNYKHSTKKTVIKVKQYSSHWKYEKTCNIRGSASNEFVGITVPFRGGNCRMAMSGLTLYLFTCREMFMGHQSNISFRINTDKMTYKEANEDYTSHSFNQYVLFSDGDLYLANHGDAYERAMDLTIVRNYGKKSADVDGCWPFEIMGDIGDNYTGATLGGMEVGNEKVLLLGTSVPQKYKVCGVRGNKSSYKKNVYVVCVDKKNCKKNKVKWLTTNNPKTSNITIDETRMVKLGEDRFAVMYSSRQGKKELLHYVVIDQNGNKILSKTYKNMQFHADVQPILHRGNIVWSQKTDSGKTYVYSIPALQ